MDRAESWLLGLVVDRWVALEWLTQTDLEQRTGQPPPDIAHPVLVNTLHSLFKKGDLVAQQMAVRSNLLPVGDDFTPTREQVEAALLGREHLAYRLTTRGGKRWEKHARPDWQRYVRHDIPGFQANQPGEIVGYDRDLVQQYLAMLHRRWNGTLIAGSEQWDTLVPWEATYWKVLSVGHRVRFRSAWKPLPAEQRGRSSPPWVEEWFRATTEAWYRHAHL